MQKSQWFKITFILFTFIIIINAENLSSNDLIDVTSLNNQILVKLIYSTTDNFLKEDSYGDLEICYLRRIAAEKLNKAQELLSQKRKGYHLLVYDGLRPRSVQFKMWEIVKGTKKQKYVAQPTRGSIHNYGAAVDLTIADENGMPLDMGTPFDYFGDLAQPRYENNFLAEGKLTKTQIANRKLLRSIMIEAGFQMINIEWWHFNAFPISEVKKRFKIVEDIPK